MCRWSEPWVRVEATSIARPVPASQAENVSISTGIRVKDAAWFSMGQIDRARYRDSIMLSKHSRAEIRWVRWKASPKQLRANAE